MRPQQSEKRLSSPSAGSHPHRKQSSAFCGGTEQLIMKNVGRDAVSLSTKVIHSGLICGIACEGRYVLHQENAGFDRIYVIDVAGGEKIPRKGGPGITKSDLFVINKTDLAPYVGADLGVMEADTKRMRKDKPFVMTNLKTREGVQEVVRFIETRGMLPQGAAV